MTWVDRFYSGMGEFLRSRGVDAVQVLRIEENRVIDNDIETVVFYKDKNKDEHAWYFDGSLMELIDEAV